MGRIVVQGQPGQKVCETASQPIAGDSGTHLSSQVMQKAEIWKIVVPSQPGQNSLQDSISMENVVALTCHPGTASLQ
jgi:hypothetical protein